MSKLGSLVRERILILDGAMGTMIQQYNLTEEDFRDERFSQIPGQMKGNNDLLCLTRPDVIQDIHRKYLAAGADIIETNTFSSTRVSMADYHVQDYVREMNLAAVRLARKVADEFTSLTPDKPRFVAGSVGPTNKTCSMSPDVNNPAFRALSYDELADAYREQMEALLEGGVDALLIETIFDTLNAKAAIFAAGQAMETVGVHVPLMLSVTVSDIGGRTLSGQTLDAFLASVQHADIFSVGLNCSFGARQLKPFLEQLAARAPYYISAYPNAGLPNSLGTYDQTPADMAHEVKEYIHEGLVNIIGGCCGTTDAYIAEYSSLIAGATPHQPVPRPENLWLSGLELLEVKPENNFVNVGERCNVAGSRKFLRLINEKKYDEALSIARQQVEDGAQVIDINMDEHNNYAVDFIRATGWIRKNLPGAHVSGGVSNLSFSFRGNNYIREAMHAVFLYYAIREGMDMGIVNPAASVLYTDIPADILERIEDVVLNRRPDAAERLIEIAERLKAEAEAAKTSGGERQAAAHSQLAWREGTPVEERLKYALTKGIGDYLEEDLAEALKLYPKAVSIIEGPLMAGMNHVGDLFGAGKMFLPQVVKTARTMKRAVAILQPVIESEKEEGATAAGKVLLATVKGDVHDIGKNIVSVVMACNGYEIIDLGVMVPAETIVQHAIEEKVDMIGLSGLITPSLDEMVHVAIELEKAGLDVPLLIGGATTSPLHTALKIAPVYHAPVIHLKDASQNATVAAKLMNPKTKEELEEELHEKYRQLCEKNREKQVTTVSLEEARKNKLNLF